MPLCRSKLCDVAALKNVVEVSSVTKTLSQVPKCGLFFSVSSNVKSKSGFFFYRLFRSTESKLCQLRGRRRNGVGDWKERKKGEGRVGDSQNT